MATLPADVTAAVASLQARWGAAAPRTTGTITDGALALAPSPAPTHAPTPDDRVIRTGSPPAPEGALEEDGTLHEEGLR